MRKGGGALRDQKKRALRKAFHKAQEKSSRREKKDAEKVTQAAKVHEPQVN